MFYALQMLDKGIKQYAVSSSKLETLYVEVCNVILFDFKLTVYINRFERSHATQTKLNSTATTDVAWPNSFWHASTSSKSFTAAGAMGYYEIQIKLTEPILIKAYSILNACTFFFSIIRIASSYCITQNTQLDVFLLPFLQLQNISQITYIFLNRSNQTMWFIFCHYGCFKCND